MITTLTGPNNFLLRQNLSRLRSAFVAEYGELAVERVDGEEARYEDILGAIESVSFLTPRKLVIIRSLSANKPVAERIDKLLDAASDSVDVVYIEPKPDKRSVYYKTLRKRTDMQEFAELDERGLTQWLASEAKNRGARLSFADANYLVQRVGASQQLLENELMKLTEYSPDITRNSIDLLTEATPQGSIFNLLDAAFAGDTKRALKLYASQRAQKEEPQKILAMIIWQIHIVALVHANGRKSADEIARDTKMSPYVLSKSKTIASKLTKTELLSLLDELCELDKKLKSQTMDADEALKNLIISLGNS